jgi:hypothetical protein
LSGPKLPGELLCKIEIKIPLNTHFKGYILMKERIGEEGKDRGRRRDREEGRLTI